MFGLIFHALLCLSVPAHDAAAVHGPSASAELRPVAWRDEPRTRAMARPVEIAAAPSELREPFLTAPPPTAARKAARAPAALREPFAHPPAAPRAAAPGPTPAPTQTGSALREPF